MGRLLRISPQRDFMRRVFRDRRYSLRSGLLVCSPPRSPLPLRPKRSQDSRDFYTRADHASLPVHASGILAVRIRQLTAVGLSPPRLAALSAATVGIELVRARFRWRVTAPALSIARRVHNSTMATFHEAPLQSRKVGFPDSGFGLGFSERPFRDG